MSTQPLSLTEQAERYMRDVAAVQQRHGMHTVASQETYRAAVAEAAAAYQGLERDLPEDRTR